MDENVYKFIKKYIDKKSRIGKLDSALLYISSSLGIVFSLLQLITGGIQAFLLFIPLWILGWLLPFYVGYIRGALLLDSVAERMRGWTYLYAGIAAYIINLLKELILYYYPHRTALSIITISFSFIILYIVFSRYPKITKTLFKIFNEELFEEALPAMRYALQSALFLGMGIFAIIEMVSFNLFLFIFLIIVTIAGFYYLERRSRICLKYYEELCKKVNNMTSESS